MLKTESRMFTFSCAYANMKLWVTLRLFSAFKGESTLFACLRIIFKFRMQTVVPVLVLLFVALWFILRGDLF